MEVPKRIRSAVRRIQGHSYKAQKVFCVGRGKTGTTSLDIALRRLGCRVAPQEPAEMMLEQWAQRDFGQFKRFCLRYDAFQEVPSAIHSPFKCAL